MKVNSYKDLQIWNLAIEQCVIAYKITKNFPSDEKYGLVSQIKKAAVSVPANIAEGYSRRHDKEKAHFISISLGSNAELETHFIIANKLGYLDSDEMSELIKINEHVGRSLTNFYRTLGD